MYGEYEGGYVYYRIVSTLIVCSVILAGPVLWAGQVGADTYAARCASCHAADGTGSRNAEKTFNSMPDLRSHSVQARTDKDLYETIARGTDHKKYPHVFLQTGLTQEQITEVVGHVRTLVKK
jgi:mono/diheme cytochrome c family protein